MLEQGEGSWLMTVCSGFSVSVNSMIILFHSQGYMEVHAKFNLNPEINSLFPRIRAVDTYKFYVKMNQMENCH